MNDPGLDLRFREYRPVNGRLDTHLLPTDLHQSVASRALTLGRNVQDPTTLRRQRTRQGFETQHFGVLRFRDLVEKHTAILSYADHKVIPQLFARLPKGVDIASPISHVDPLLLLWNGSDGLDAVLPYLRFSHALFSLRLCLPLRGSLTDKGFLIHAPKQRLAYRHPSPGPCARRSLVLCSHVRWNPDPRRSNDSTDV